MVCTSKCRRRCCTECATRTILARIIYRVLLLEDQMLLLGMWNFRSHSVAVCPKGWPGLMCSARQYATKLQGGLLFSSLFFGYPASPYLTWRQFPVESEWARRREREIKKRNRKQTAASCAQPSVSLLALFLGSFARDVTASQVTQSKGQLRGTLFVPNAFWFGFCEETVSREGLTRRMSEMMLASKGWKTDEPSFSLHLAIKNALVVD